MLSWTQPIMNTFRFPFSICVTGNEVNQSCKVQCATTLSITLYPGNQTDLITNASKLIQETIFTIWRYTLTTRHL